LQKEILQSWIQTRPPQLVSHCSFRGLHYLVTCFSSLYAGYNFLRGDEDWKWPNYDHGSC